MPKAKSTGAAWYAVAKGRQTGIYETWDECSVQVSGFAGARHKKFHTRIEAERWLQDPSKPPAPRPAPKAVVKAVKSTETGIDEQGRLVVYTDGACKGNGQQGAVAGVGVWWGHDHSRNIAEPCPGPPAGQTNNRAELIAIIRLLETSRDLIPQPMLIKTDSQYSIKCIKEWLSGWRKRNFFNASGRPVSNKPLITYLDALLVEREALGQKVDLEYVKGHAGIEGNEGADSMATLGSTKPPMPDEPDWAAKEAEVREAIKAISSADNTIVQGNSSVANAPKVLSTIETERPSAIPVSASRSSRQILESPSNSDYIPQDKPDTISAPAPPSPERASRAFKPYRRPTRPSSPSISRINTTTAAALPESTAFKDTSTSPPWTEVNTPTTPMATRPGYAATRSIRHVKPLDVEFECSGPYFFSGVSPIAKPSTEKLYRDVSTMTVPVATYGELSTQELEQYACGIADHDELERELEEMG